MTARDLKNALLQEAVQGKLVPQIVAEGNAKDLLEEIKKEKEKLIKEGKIKKEKPLPEITDDEIPFDIPENWCWCRWGDLSESIQYGYNAPAKETGRIKMVRISDIHENKVFWDSVPYCDISEDEIQTYILKKNDILFARTGGTVGKSFLVQDVPCEAIYAGYLIRTHYNSEKLVPQYLKFFMESNLYWEQLKEGTIATAQPNCNGKTLSKMLIPLPPLAEQKRIVAAIEKFMPLIEEYGKKESELKAFNEQIGVLTKKAILQEAVQGKLVPQIATEGNAKDLLEEIKKEKTKLLKERKIKKEKTLPEITEDEIPFDIPESWCWCRLGEISTNITAGGDKPSHFSKTITEKLTVPVISNGEKDDGVFGYTDRATVTEKAITVSGRGNIGFTKVRSEPFMPIVRLITITFPNILDFKYLEIAISFLVTDGNGSAVQQLTVPMIKPLLIPLPPLAEQKRIVAAIEKILPLCEKLGE